MTPTASKASRPNQPGGRELSDDRITDRDFLRNDQYRQPDNLRARITLHERFSTNGENWFGWLFDCYQLSPEARVLEIGCGPGDVWVNNREQIQPGWRLTLSDLSEGMVARARQNLGQGPFRYCCLDADVFPFPADSFDAVIANHMLYHVPDIEHTLSEVCRVLVPDGRLIAATNGEGHLAQLTELIRDFDPDYPSNSHTISFTLENGSALLNNHFKRLERFDFPNDLHITEVEPLVDYTLSLWSINREFFLQHLDEFRTYLQAIMDRDGVIKINKSVGVVISQKPRK